MLNSKNRFGKFTKNPAKAVLLAVIVSAVGFAGLQISMGAPNNLGDTEPTQPEATEQILVQYKAGINIQSLVEKFSKLKVSQVDEVKSYRVKVLKVPESQRDQILKELAADPTVQSAEVDHIYQAHVTTPNDTDYAKQWAIPKIQLNQMWDKAKGSNSVIVAVLDTGINYSHPEFAGKTVPGTDYINNDNDPADDKGHGSQAAGTIAALTNNATGIAGGCWNCRIMPIKVLDSKGNGPTSGLLKGVEFATRNGAKVINLSLGGGGSSNVMQTAVDQAIAKGIVVVASAGNNGLLSSAGTPQYPANYGGVLSVAATDQSDLLADYSSHGQHVDIAAPGQVLAPTYPGTGYTTVKGTSFSAPLVSSIIAVLASAFPAATVVDLTNAVTSTTEVCCSGKIGGGRINAQKALAKLEAKFGVINPSPNPNPTPPTPTPPPPTPTPPTPNPTPGKIGDTNGDSKVNITDLSVLLSKWGTADTKADLNKSGKVDITDLSLLLSNWTG